MHPTPSSEKLYPISTIYIISLIASGSHSMFIPKLWVSWIWVRVWWDWVAVVGCDLLVVPIWVWFVACFAVWLLVCGLLVGLVMMFVVGFVACFKHGVFWVWVQCITMVLGAIMDG